MRVCLVEEEHELRLLSLKESNPKKVYTSTKTRTWYQEHTRSSRSSAFNVYYMKFTPQPIFTYSRESHDDRYQERLVDLHHACWRLY
jgi:hypothetical protein